MPLEGSLFYFTVLICSPAQAVENQLEPQLSNPTKERVKGPMGRRLPSKKVQVTTNKAINEEEEKEQVTAALREFRTAAKRVREARDLDEVEEKKYEAEEKKDEVSSCDMSRQGVVDSADFDRAWFFRVPSFSCHTTTGKRPKSETIDIICENNNMSTNNNNNNRDSVVVPNSTNSEGELEGKEPEPGSREGSSDASEGSGKKRRFWKSREFNCNIL